MNAVTWPPLVHYILMLESTKHGLFYSIKTLFFIAFTQHCLANGEVSLTIQNKEPKPHKINKGIKDKLPSPKDFLKHIKRTKYKTPISN